MHMLARSTDRLRCRPVLMFAPHAAMLSIAVDQNRASFERQAADPLDAFRTVSEGATRADAQARPSLAMPPAAGEAVEELPEAGAMLVDGVAIFEVRGGLWDTGYGWGGRIYHHGYDTLARGLQLAQADGRVRAVMLRVDSPGGIVDGLPGLAATIRANSARAGLKPVHAFVSGVAYSAAYWIAASCDRITASTEASVGSIGAVILHWDETAWLERLGFKVTPVTFGAEKVATAFFTELSERARADLQAQIDHAGGLFVADVVKGRPGLGAEAVIATEARVFTAEAGDAAYSALALGLIDEVAFFDEAFAALRDSVADASPAAAPAASPGAAATETETEDMSKRTRLNVRKLKARAEEGDLEAIAALAGLAVTATEELEDAAEGDDEDTAEGDEEDTAEGDDEDTAEGDEEDVAEGDDEDTAEGDDEDTAEGDDEDMAQDDEDKPAARRRAKRIMALPEARGRQKMARSLARQGLSVKAAKGALRALPRHEAFSARDHRVGADGGDGGQGGDARTKEASRLSAAYAAATGRHPRRRRRA